MGLLQILERIDGEAQLSDREYEHNTEEETRLCVSEHYFPDRSQMNCSYGTSHVGVPDLLLDLEFFAGLEDLDFPNMMKV